MLYDNIKNDLNKYNKSINKINISDKNEKINFLSENINFNIIKPIIGIIYEEKDFFENILELYVKIIEKNANEISLEEIKKKLKKRVCIKKEKAKKIYYFLDNIGFIDEIFDNKYSEVIIYSSDTKDNDEFIELRENQIKAFEIIEYKIYTGIHCQATGCGKSYIIIRYIHKCFLEYGEKTKIILFTERCSILSDLFGFTNNDNKPNKEKLEKWKKDGIGDLTKINILNCVTNKNKLWFEELNKNINLIVINRAFLTTTDYNKIDKLNMILHDECHNTTSKQCNDFLHYFHNKNIPIIGFSATPLRTGKNDLEELCKIYGENNKLKLLTNYNMLYSITKNLILPPEFYWYEIDNKINDKNDNQISDYELGVVLDILNKLIPLMPYKKIVAWCGTIDRTRLWKKRIEENYKQRVNMLNFNFYIDTSKDSNEDYKNFYESDGCSILFCANKHREGSDIKKLDACIFLDGVKNRGCIPFIQAIGRVLRIDKEKNKKCGIIIEGIYNENKYETNFVDKIIGYYMALNNVCNDETSEWDKYIELREIVKFDKERQVINVKINKKLTIKINLNTVKWDDIVEHFDEILQKKCKISIEENIIHKGKILVEKFNFNERTNFYKKYKKISEEDKKKYNLPNIYEDNYDKLFVKKNWFDFLKLKHNFYLDQYEAKEGLENNGIKIIEPTKNWKKWCKKDKRLPKYPKYLWENWDINFFSSNDKNNEII